MNCCSQCQGIEQVFDSKVAKRELESYRKKGPAKTTVVLLDWIKTLGQSKMTLMDVGGGVGIIQHELFRAGVIDTAVHVDAALPYLKTSEEEARRLGHVDKVTYKQGDFVDLAEEIDAADLVTLDRVICCYHDMPAMVRAAAVCSNKYIGLVFPRDKWYLRWGMAAANLGLRLFRNPFRLFIHSQTAVDELLQSRGFKRQAQREFFIWQSMLYVKQED